MLLYFIEKFTLLKNLILALREQPYRSINESYYFDLNFEEKLLIIFCFALTIPIILNLSVIFIVQFTDESKNVSINFHFNR